MSGLGRGRVETSNLRYHAVSARSEALGIVTAALCAAARLIDLIEVVSKVTLQMRLAARPPAFILQERGP